MEGTVKIKTPIAAQFHYRFMNNEIALRDKHGGVPIAIVPEREDREEQEAIALEMVAVLNAHDALTAERDALLAQRDALVGACERAEKFIAGWCSHVGSTSLFEYREGRKVKYTLSTALALVRGEVEDA
jgi:hypothetical protein